MTSSWSSAREWQFGVLEIINPTRIPRGNYYYQLIVLGMKVLLLTHITPISVWRSILGVGSGCAECQKDDAGGLLVLPLGHGNNFSVG